MTLHKLGFIPDGWEKKKISDIAEVNPSTPLIACINGTEKPLSNDDMVSFIPMEAVSEDGQVTMQRTKKYSEAGSGYTSFKNKDILIAKITPCFENYKGTLVDNLTNGIGFGSTEFHVLRAKPGISAEWLHIVTRDHKFRARGELNMQGSAGQKRVPTDFLRGFHLAVPIIKEEQDAIARYYGIWENGIKLVELLIATKLLRRKALMHQLLTGKRRFSGFAGRWSTRRLKELVKQVHRPTEKPTIRYRALGIRSHFKGTFERYIDDPSTVEMDQLYIAKSGDLIVNITFAWEGAIAIVPEEHDGGLVSHRFPMFRAIENETDLNFLRHIVTQPRFLYLLGVISPGGAGRNRVLNKKDFLDLEISVPEFQEQRHIGQILAASEREITLLRSLLKDMKEQKKGLMQQLLTGKRRVNMSAAT